MNAYEQMRDALELVNEIYDLLSKPCIVIEEVRQACQKARAVLISMPQRNCDMGTAEEQAERYNAFCRKHFTPDKLGGNCRECPLRNRRGWSCQLAWAQMPYAEEGGAK